MNSCARSSSKAWGKPNFYWQLEKSNLLDTAVIQCHAPSPGHKSGYHFCACNHYLLDVPIISKKPELTFHPKQTKKNHLPAGKNSAADAPSTSYPALPRPPPLSRPGIANSGGKKMKTGAPIPARKKTAKTVVKGWLASFSKLLGR